MRRTVETLLIAGSAAMVWPSASRAQAPAAGAPDSAAAPPVEAYQAPKREPRVYFGGSLSFAGFGKTLLVSVEPFVGYRLTPKASLGARIAYQYRRDSRIEPPISSHNYGAGLFTRYRVLRLAYAQAEFAFTSYEVSNGRDVVPFLLLGGGYARPLGPRSWLLVDVLFDVLQDEHSPYRDWEPRVTTSISTSY